MVSDLMMIANQSALITTTGMRRVRALTYMRLACARGSRGSPCIGTRTALKGGHILLAAAVLNSTVFYALVNIIMSFQTHNLLFSRQRAPKPQQLQQQHGQQRDDRSTDVTEEIHTNQLGKWYTRQLTCRGSCVIATLKQLNPETLKRGQTSYPK